MRSAKAVPNGCQPLQSVNSPMRQEGRSSVDEVTFAFRKGIMPAAAEMP